MQHASEAPPSVASRVSDAALAKQLDDVIAHGLAKERENRIQTIEQFRSEITKIVGVDSPSVRKTSTMSAMHSSSKEPAGMASRSKSRAMKLTAGVAVVLMIAGGFVVISNARKADREREERAAKAKAEENRPQTRDEMIALWKHLDMKGQTQFNTGQYALSEKTFRHALELGRQIDPDGPQVQNALEELIDLSTAQNKPPEPNWEKALKRITSVALKLQQKESAELKRDAERLAGQSPGARADSPQVKRVVDGSIECAQELFWLGDIDGALSLLDCLDAVTKRFPGTHKPWDGVVRYLKTEVSSYRSSVNVAAQARQTLLALERDITHARKLPDPDPGLLGERYQEAAAMARLLHDYPKALKYLKESTDAVLSASGSTSVRYGDALIAEAFLYDELGQRGKAQQKALAALKVYKGPKVSEASDPRYLNRIADIYTFLGEYENAASTLTESLALQQKAEIKNYAGIADCLIQIAHVGVLQKRTAGLVPLLERAIAIRKRIRSELVNYISSPLRLLGNIALLEGRAQEAEGFYKHALQLDLSDTRDAEHRSAVEDYAALAKLYGSYGTRGGDEKAVAALKSQVDIYLRTYGNRSVVLVPLQMEIARIYEKRGDYQEAEKVLVEAEKLAEKSEIPVTPRNLARIYIQHARILEEMGRPTQAAKLREKAIK
jgi:tetratricopeptide (TPR) repeat protein